ncbi:MAG: hypothetical protein K6E55_07805, partial [Thermoguttaceae bacterium]|nr:hypothetical protein [Thermoguttaceae bacterium]
TPGQSYYIGWIISDVEGETETGNNTACCPTKITIPVPVADLAANNGGSLSVSDGKFTLVTGTITNVGTGTAATGYKINVYASTDATIGATDTLLTTYTVSSSLFAGQSTQITISNISTGMLTVGANYYIGWIITDVSGEIVTSNNTASCTSQLTVTGTPNLQASDGGSYTVRFDDVKAIIELTTGTFSNRGTGKLESETYQISVYASSDTSIDNTDRLLRTRYVSEAFNAGESKVLHFDAIGLTNIIVGNTYYIGWIVTDANGHEITKAYCPIQMTAQGVTDLDASNGGTFSISGTKITLTTGNIKNLGTQKASAGSYSIRVFLSKNTNISPDEDIRIAVFNDTPYVLYGESKAVKIPNIDISAFGKDTLPAGTYYVGWIIRGVDGETRTNNNTAYCTAYRLRVQSDRSIVTYPLPSSASAVVDSVFAEYQSADLETDLSVF